MDKLREFVDKMANVKPKEWKDIPDIDLYMDQVISYMKRQHIGLDLEGEEVLTPAMINNYIKNGLLPRAKGKRYDSEHIAYLTAICLLKQVLSVNETGILLKKEMENRSTEDFYNEYRELVGSIFSETAANINCGADKAELTKEALKMAVSSYADMLACKRILQILKQGQ